MIDQIAETTEYIRKRIKGTPEIGVILGTAWATCFAKEIMDQVVINYNAIPNFPAATVETHKGQLILVR